MSEDDAVAAVVQRLLPAPPDVVYDEWLDADALADWMCPLPARATKIECDPRIGGSLRMVIADSGTTTHVTGVYLELDRPHRLSFTWDCDVGVTDTVVTVTLEPHGNKQTLMTIRHTHLPPDAISDYTKGWTEIAKQLDDKLRALT